MKIPDFINNISIEDFNYDLPDQQIAKYPLEKRDQSKLLVWKNGDITDELFTNLPGVLPAQSLLVFNNTKVIKARLLFLKETGARIEIFVLDPVEPADYARNFQQTHSCKWKCIVGNLKKWKQEKLHLTVTIRDTELHLFAEKTGVYGNSLIVEFSWDNQNFTFSEVLEAAGNIPIPPYLHRESEIIDVSRYQTVYSKIKGSVAAPTAGLHFTDNIFSALMKKGIDVAELTLHVGAGTFQPVKEEKIGNHQMHTEHIQVERSFIEKITNCKTKIIAVGTTSIRTLESMYWMGAKVNSNPKTEPEKLKIAQWEPYLMNTILSREQAFSSLLNYMDKNNLEQIDSSTQVIILPGYSFRVIDGMITNFHQPKSTLLLLISAYLGNDWREIYDHALKNKYRFLSYGDSNLYMK